MSQENVEVVRRRVQAVNEARFDDFLAALYTKATSGTPALLSRTLVYMLRDGKVIETREYATVAKALEAAGLSE